MPKRPYPRWQRRHDGVLLYLLKHPSATRMLRLSFLAPDITRAILHGHQPANLNARKLMADTRVPIDWDKQRAGPGFI